MDQSNTSKPDNQVDESKERESAEADKKLLEIAHSRFKLSSEAEEDQRRDALDDIKFSAGEQWEAQVKNARSLDRRPCLVVNRLPQFIRQITNDQRQNRPSIKVNPVDDNADPETARIKQGLIRHIEYNSNADAAYDTAFDGAVRGGFGYFRIVTDYCDPMTFDQELLIKRIPNQFKVYFDPSSREPDGSDAEFAFVVEDLTKEQYKEQYPDSEMSSLEDFSSIGDGSMDWLPDGLIRVAEYLYKDYKKVKLHMLKGGTIVSAEDLPDPLPAGVEIHDTRETKIPVVRWVKLNGKEILEQQETVFDEYIPIIPVYGEDLEIDGKRTLCGVVRYAKDPQRMYNYWKSAETETIALAPRAPFIGAAGQFEGHENKWRTANTLNHAYLEYNPKDVGGVALPAPQRQSYEPAIQAITMAAREASEDIKATTGIYDAALGNRSNENSGIAIQRRNQQSQTANFHFVDNLARSIKHAGRILVRAIPKVYDGERTARIIGDDGQQELVPINKVYQKNGQMVAHNLDDGKYDVTVDTGPSYATKRQEAAASMLDFLKVYPQGAPLIADLVAGNMDWPGAQDVRDRLKKGLPPGMADDKDSPQLDPQIKAAMDQSQQMIDKLTQELNAAHDAMDGKRMELEFNEKIEMAKLDIKRLEIQSNIEIEMAKMGSKESQVLLAHQVGAIQHERDLTHAVQLADADREHQAEMAEQIPEAPQGEPEPTGGQSPGLTMETP